MPDPNATIRRLVMADGTVLDESECGYADRNLWCFLKNLTFNQAFQIFSDPAKTQSIRFEYGLDSDPAVETYDGFIYIMSINRREQTIDICLVREVPE